MPFVDQVTDPATWYLGPVGNLWPLFCPEPGVSISNVRYGGIHQGLSGKRTLDITGYQYEYKMQFKYLTAEDYEWLEMLHERAVPGPFRLLNPMKKNRLSQQSSLTEYTPSDNDGISYIGNVDTKLTRDWPQEASKYGTHCIQVSDWGSVGDGIQFDHFKAGQSGTIVFPSEPLTISIFLRLISGNSDFTLDVDYYRVDETLIQSTSTTLTAQSNWQRFSHEITSQEMPDDCVVLSFSLRCTNTNSVVNVAAPQIEHGTLSSWEIGGAAPTVIMNQLPLKSPRFPLRNAQMTLLEA